MQYILADVVHLTHAMRFPRNRGNFRELHVGINLIEKFTTKNDLTKIRAPMAKFSFGDQSSAKFEIQKLIKVIFLQSL